LKPEYNIEKIAGSSLGLKRSEETKAKISKSLKGVYVGPKSSLFGKTHDELTKSKMSDSKLGKKNSFYGKTHSEETKSLMSSLKLGKKHSELTKDLISKKKGLPVFLYEKDSDGVLNLIGTFVSGRKTAEFLNISNNTVNIYLKSGKLFKDKYLFSRNLINSS
jgi:group I intron endonuclease